MSKHDAEDALTPSNLPSLRELQVLRAMIASRKTIAAAHQLGVSQPAVSRAIASLEARVGRALFLRDGGRLAPTADAFALEAEAAVIFGALERLTNWSGHSDVSTTIRIAAAPTLAQYVLTRFVKRMSEIEPGLRFNVEIGTGNDVMAAVAERRADLGLVDLPATHAGIRAEVLREARGHVLMPEGHRLAQLSEVTAQDLAGEELIMLARRFSVRGEVDRAFQKAGLVPNIVAEVSTSSFASDLVRIGVGLAIFNPFPLTLKAMDGLIWRPYAPSIPYRTCLLFPVAGAVLPAARRFADLMLLEMPEDGVTTPIRPHS
jgi:DNA-binding transcriptional LysR family regulator